MTDHNALVVFQDKKIRRVWHENEWYFSVVDVINALETSTIPKRYWSDLKTKLSAEGFELYDKIVQLAVSAELPDHFAGINKKVQSETVTNRHGLKMLVQINGLCKCLHNVMGALT
ncbi:MAG: hypothetical protein AABX47_03980 [Nanoarchaeota archaeon]